MDANTAIQIIELFLLKNRNICGNLESVIYQPEAIAIQTLVEEYKKLDSEFDAMLSLNQI